ncbi:hypothetical protein L9F63_024190, partial [Diploptera punctata]
RISKFMAMLSMEIPTIPTKIRQYAISQKVQGSSPGRVEALTSYPKILKKACRILGYSYYHHDRYLFPNK